MLESITAIALWFGLAPRRDVVAITTARDELRCGVAMSWPSVLVLSVTPSVVLDESGSAWWESEEIGASSLHVGRVTGAGSRS